MEVNMIHYFTPEEGTYIAVGLTMSVIILGILVHIFKKNDERIEKRKLYLEE